MARGVNKVILVGHVGKDPEIRSMAPSGRMVANFSLATTEVWKDKQTEEKKESTEWHRLVCFEPLANNVVQRFVKQGMLLYIEGKLKTRKWQDQSGQDRYTTEIVVSDLQMLGSKGENSHNSFEGYEEMADQFENTGSTGNTGNYENNFSKQPADNFTQNTQSNTPISGNEPDDDIPF